MATESAWLPTTAPICDVSVPMTRPVNGALFVCGSKFAKNSSLSLMIGPLTSMPHCRWLKSVTGLWRLSRPTRLKPATSVPCQNPKSEACHSLVPDRVTALTRPPVKPPCRTSKGAICTWNSRIASTEIGREFACPPGVPLPARPNRSLFTLPSIWMLL